MISVLELYFFFVLWSLYREIKDILDDKQLINEENNVETTGSIHIDWYTNVKITAVDNKIVLV